MDRSFRPGPPRCYPISVKGVVVRAGRVLLLRNERNEWELPGGRLEAGETPEPCVVREIWEETGWRGLAGPLLDAWVYDIATVKRQVFIVTYGCVLPSDDVPEPVVSGEHQEARDFTEEEVPYLDMPQGYKASVASWFSMLPRRG